MSIRGSRSTNWIVRVAAIAAMLLVATIAISSTVLGSQTKDYINGVVFMDDNANGKWDVGEEGYKGKYGVYEDVNGNWSWGHKGTMIKFSGVGGGPAEPTYLETAGYRMPDEDGNELCSLQGENRPCEGTFGFISFADYVTWDATVMVPEGYKLTTPGTQRFTTGMHVPILEFGIERAYQAPLVETTPIVDISSGGIGPAIPGAMSTLTRDANGISVAFDTSNLPVGHVVTLWAYTFNDPIHCNDNGCNVDDMFINAMTPPLFTNPDGTVGRPGTDFSLMGLGGHIIDDSGSQLFVGSIMKGTAPQVVFGNGLNDPMNAEIHFALRDHGPASSDPATLDMQLNVGNGGCLNFGGSGDYPCVDFQLALMGVAPR